VTQVLEFLKRYGKLIGAGIAAAAVAVLVSNGLAARKAEKTAEAERMLREAQTHQQLENVVENYQSTPTAPAALLSLAKTLFNDGETAQARAQYERFVKEYKNSDLLPIAEFGLAHCTEAEGDFAAAVNEFKDFLADRPGSYLEAPATLALARCLEQSGQKAEARIALEDFLAQNADPAWSDSVEDALERLGE
jgi:TolA-binding protein